MEEPREARFWRFEEDFGISLLIATLGTGLTPVVPDGDADDARALRDDARLLLDSRLPAETLRTVWRAAAAGQDPGPDVPGLLRRIVESAEDRIAREAAGLSSGDTFFDGTPPMVTVDEPAMRKAVCAEVRAVAHQLTGSDVGAALERVAAEVDADLGFRLFLRVVKETPVAVTMERYDRYLTIGEVFGYPRRLVHDGLDVRWPRFDDASLRRRFSWDFGFSYLAGRFHGDLWQHSYTVDEGIRGAASDYAGPVPGSSAYALLEDTLRLSRSPMSDDALTELWQAATGYGYDPQDEGVGARQWLHRIAEVCIERLREIDPGFTVGATPPGDFEALNAVRRELREIAPVLTRAVHDSPWYGATTSPWFEHSRTVVPALEQVVDQVDPDLGFRLLLTCVRAYDVPVTDEQYARWTALGDRFGYGRRHVADLADPHAER
ncbi:hypothetical protein ABT075_21520 [Streptomyces sp. NPDC002677]|uniref:hypothetical protein n=1 Tax=Streptomyces sp. NPDC002677 TaxID=3154774 RepID=UPI00331E3692